MVKIILLEIFFPIISAFIIGLLFIGIFRKILARIQWRYGPPVLQPFIDIIKLFNQKGFSHGDLFDFGIFLSIAGSMVVILSIPFAGLCFLKNSGGLLVLLYLLIFVPIGRALSAGASANPNASIGISRKLILSLAYEIPFILIVLSIMSYYKTISFIEIVNAQKNFHWALFSPLVFSGISYFLILPAMLGIRPFDIVSAPQEISSGDIVEYGGQFLSLFHIEHALHLFIYLALFVNLFLGGGNIFVFLLKIFIVFIIGIFIHSVFPRLRTDQAIKYLWGYPTIFALLGMILILILK